MSEILNTQTENTQTVSTPEVISVTEPKITNVEINKSDKSYKFWARFNQVLVIIGGVFSLPFGAIAIVAGIQLNKSIENIDKVAKDEETTNFVNSVKSFHKWMVINVMVSIGFLILVSILFGGIILALITQSGSTMNKSNFDTGYNSSNNINNKRGSTQPMCTDADCSSINQATKAQKESVDFSKGMNISNEEGNMTVDKDGNMKITDKDGKVTSINADGTMSTEK